MKSYLFIAVIIGGLWTSGFSQEQLLGKSKADALTQIPHQITEPLEGKEYPLIKETIKLEGIQDWNGVSTVYLFIDSTDRVCRLHMIYAGLTSEERKKLADEVKASAKAKEDLTDKKHTTFIGRTKVADYILTWAKDKNRSATYLLVTANDYKQRMLNYLVNGGSLPEDGIFTPSPSK
jgi:hypothetical protein